MDELQPPPPEAKTKKQGKRQRLFVPLGQAFVRIPTLPIEALSSAENGVGRIKKDPLLHEAIFIASSSLIASLARPEAIPPRRLRQLHSSLLRYVVRMSSRTTPFGLFAGVAQIAIGKQTSLPLAEAAIHRHRSRLDMEWLLGYIKLLETDPSVLPSLTYVYQPIAVRIGNRYHFEHWDEKGSLTNTSVIATLGLELLIEKTRHGKQYADLFTEMLAAVPEAKPEEMTAFLRKFLRYGLVRSSLQPPLTCADPAQHVARQLDAIPAARAIAQQFRSLLSQIKLYDMCAPGDGEATLRKLADSTNSVYQLPAPRLPLGIDLTLRFTREPQLQQSIADDAAHLAELLMRLSVDPSWSSLSAYREKFIEQYGQHRRIPILELLDPNLGIGLPEHYRSAGHHSKKSSSGHQAKRDKVLHALALWAVRSQQTIVNLNDTTVERLTHPDFKIVSMPRSLDLGIQIAAVSEERVNDCEYLVVSSPIVGAQVAGQSAGRFADLLGKTAIDYLRQTAELQSTSEPSCVHAEVVYLPRTGHAANVAIRPPLRTYEIILGTAPGVPNSQVIPLDDILVGVRHNSLYLWSISHQKELIAYSGHMLNRKSAPSACRFMLDVSGDRQSMLTEFSWGTAAYLPMLPRITYGRLVLALAQWRLDVEDLLGAADDKKIGRPTMTPDAWLSRISAWRDKWHVPRYVYLAESDNRLLLDLESKTQAMELFYAATGDGKFGALRIQEALPGPDTAWIHGAEGHYLNEFIIPLVCKPAASGAAPQGFTHSAPISTEIATNDRLHLPGSRWLYCKLYLPALQQNECLALYIEPLIRAVAERHAAEQWFFIRYTDPEPHIRIRFNAKEQIVVQMLLPIIFSWARQMQAAGILQRFVIDSYDREIERYGGASAIESAEAIFAAESTADLELICLNERNASGDWRLSDIAVLTTSILLAAFGYDDQMQAEWAKRQVKGYKQFADEYRKDRDNILMLFQQYRDKSLMPDALQATCRRLELQLKPIGHFYHSLDTAKKLTIPLEEIISSFRHMHSNRLIGIDRRIEQRTLVYVSRVLQDLPKWRKK